MELCSSGNLSNYIKQHRSLPESTCRYFLRQLSAALKYMRSNDVSHFDLKPQNLLITQTPQLTLKVADFGFAQHLASDEQNTSMKGSPLYMAPEILLSHLYNAKADLWSIGIILYECLFGAAPYASKSVAELVEKVRAHKPIDIPRNAKVSDECLDLLARLLQHNPAKRIDFVDYFNHDFLDLKHFPNEENFEKARSLVTRAVQNDTNGNYLEAYHLYCESLQYFIPVVSSGDPCKYAALKGQVRAYLERAEEIRRTVLLTRSLDSMTVAQAEPVEEEAREIVESDDPTSSRLSVRGALKPSPLYQQLCNYNPAITAHHKSNVNVCVSDPLTGSSPAIRTAMEIGRKGELYIFERNFAVALDNFKAALGQLVPLLATEPKGQRRDMLHQLVQFWMREAESLKSIISAQSWKAATTDPEINRMAITTSCTLQ